MTEAIEELARKCAVKGLRLRDAVALFEALYFADALAIAGGKIERATEIAGVGRTEIARRRRKRKPEQEEAGEKLAIDP